MYREPRLSVAIFAALVAIATVALAGYVPDEYPVIGGAVAVAAFVLFGAALLYLFNWFIFCLNAHFAEYKRSMAVTIRIEEMRAAARLSHEQAKLIPMAEYAAQVGVIDTEVGPQYVLICPGGNIPLPWVYDFLSDCGMWRLKPIREYPDKTPGREYARVFTDWCIWRQLAIPAVGNEPAHWTSEHAKQRAAQMCGLELEA